MTLRGGNSTDACSEQAGARWADAPGTGRSCARPAVSRRGRDKRRLVPPPSARAIARCACVRTSAGARARAARAPGRTHHYQLPRLSPPLGDCGRRLLARHIDALVRHRAGGRACAGRGRAGDARAQGRAQSPPHGPARRPRPLTAPFVHPHAACVTPAMPGNGTF